MLEYTPGIGEAKQSIYLGSKQIATRRLLGSALDLDRDGIADAQEIGQLPGTVTASEELVFLHTDAIGSPVAATAHPDGSLLWRENYRPYGERQVNSVLAGTNNRWFAGKPQDEETGLSYFGARYYDPVVGRFMGVDPVAPDPTNVHSLNRYAYANNNPYRYVDPDGRIPVDTIWDGANVLYDIGKIAAGWTMGNQPWIASGTADLGLDVGAMLIPYVPAGITKVVGAAGVVKKDILISRARYGEAADHIADAQKAGHPDVLEIARGGAPANRKASIGGLAKVLGKQQDEYPPAMFKEGGAGASVRAINPKDNLAAGACIGNSCRGLANGDKVRIRVVP